MGLIRFIKNHLNASVQKDRQRVQDILARQTVRLPDEQTTQQALDEFNARLTAPKVTVMPESPDQRLKREIETALSMSDEEYRRLYDRHKSDMSMVDRDPFTLSNMS